MAFYDIAGLRVEIKRCGKRTKKQARPYLASNQSDDLKADITVDVSDEKINSYIEKHPELGYDDWDYMLSGSEFYAQLLKFRGMLLHSSCIVVDNIAYAFSADSGTGKSTHANLWLENFGERAHMLNDDKPAIRKIDGKIYACGTPWSGKYDYSTPENIRLGGICFIERSKTNYIKKANTNKAIFNIFSQTVRKLGETGMNLLFDVIEDIFSSVPLYELGCDISQEAFEVSSSAMLITEEELDG
ncbi:MAG: hypothetical protein IKI34_02090 [Eubacterium sp.]|nr:hypothetical protein [Eubacterium sp.]